MRLTGVRKFVFDKIIKILSKFEKEKFTAGGRPPKLIIEDQALLMLQYYREYCTIFSLASNYNVSESTAWRIIIKIEKILIESKLFSLPGKKECLNSKYNDLLIDVTESPIERPKKNKGRAKNIQKNFYSGKKKKHTIKTQVVYCGKIGQIIACTHRSGRVHDFRILKESKFYFHQKTKVLADSGYQGILGIHGNSVIPIKKIKNKELTNESKVLNRECSSQRIEIENVFGVLKRFRIIAEKYRNRRKRFNLRFTLIASIFNMQNKVRAGL